VIASITLSFAIEKTFTLTASLPGSVLDGQVVNAVAGAFYLGLSTPGTYCPEEVNPNCPNVAGTVLTRHGALFM